LINKEGGRILKNIIWSIVLAIVVAFLVTPGTEKVKAEELSVLNTEISVLSDSDSKTIYKVTEDDGKTYQYIDMVTEIDSVTDKISTEKYLLNGDGTKTFITNQVVSVEDTIEGMEIQDLLNLDREMVSINTIKLEETSGPIGDGLDPVNPPILMKSSPQSYSTLANYNYSGGSYIASIYYDYNTRYNYAHAVNGGKAKETKPTVWQFRDFIAAADNIKKEERDIATFGLIGVADAVWAAVKKGDLLSYTLIKKVFSRMAKAVPVIGTIMTIYSYISTCRTASKKWDLIPSKAYGSALDIGVTNQFRA
jgi:hypothetical protein